MACAYGWLTPPVDPKTTGKYLVALGGNIRQGDFEEKVSVCACLCGCCMRTNLLVGLSNRLVAFKKYAYMCVRVYMFVWLLVYLSICMCVSLCLCMHVVMLTCLLVVSVCLPACMSVCISVCKRRITHKIITPSWSYFYSLVAYFTLSHSPWLRKKRWKACIAAPHFLEARHGAFMWWPGRWAVHKKREKVSLQLKEQGVQIRTCSQQPSKARRSVLHTWFNRCYKSTWPSRIWSLMTKQFQNAIAFMSQIPSLPDHNHFITT